MFNKNKGKIDEWLFELQESIGNYDYNRKDADGVYRYREIPYPIMIPSYNAYEGGANDNEAFIIIDEILYLEKKKAKYHLRLEYPIEQEKIDKIDTINISMSKPIMESLNKKRRDGYKLDIYTDQYGFQMLIGIRANDIILNIEKEFISVDIKESFIAKLQEESRR